MIYLRKYLQNLLFQLKMWFENILLFEEPIPNFCIRWFHVRNSIKNERKFRCTDICVNSTSPIKPFCHWLDWFEIYCFCTQKVSLILPFDLKFVKLHPPSYTASPTYRVLPLLKLSIHYYCKSNRGKWGKYSRYVSIGCCSFSWNIGFSALAKIHTRVTFLFISFN